MTTQTLLLPPEPHHRVSRDRARELFARMRATVAAITDPAEAERIAEAARDQARKFSESHGR
jgi:siroheme synthase (precorrin-2 oxidase/ferrochelatase)